MTNDSSRTEDAASWDVIAAVRRRWWVVAVVAVVALAAAAFLASRRTPSYEASAQILVTPYTNSDAALAGIRVLRETNDGARDLQTATALLTSPRTAASVARASEGAFTADQVELDVALEPVGGSNTIAVTATSPAPATAARLANLYADAAIAERNASVGAQARDQLRRLDGIENPELTAIRQQLRVFRDQGDPTLEVTQAATTPSAPAGPSDRMILLAALVAGLVLGGVGAVLLERGDRRVRDRDQFVSSIPAPVLIGVPSPRGHEGIDMPPPVREAFRTLQIQLDLREHEGCRRILVTSASSGDGKTTTVLNLAFALVSAGHRVIVVDFDVRKPDVGPQLGVTDPTNLATSLATGQPVTAIMRPAPRLPPMRVVQVASGPGDIAMLPLLTRRMQDVLAETIALADYVLVDTPPLGEVGDALPLVDHVDDVLVVGRPGRTDGRALETMSGLLKRAGVTPTGWIVTGVDAVSSRYYHDDPRGDRGTAGHGALDRWRAAFAGR